MKRYVGSLLAVILVFSLCGVAAAEEPAWEITYQQVEDPADYGVEQNTVARNTKTGEILPISQCDFSWEGTYVYAYAPAGTEWEPVTVEPAAFSDLEEGSGYPYGISQMAARGVLQGTPEGQFLPDKTLSRAEMAAVLARLASLPDGSGTGGYADVPADSWHAGSVTALQELGVLVPDTNFFPDREVTRQELVTMVCRLTRAIGTLPSPDADALALSDVADGTSVADYAREAYAALRQAGFDVLEDVEWWEDAPIDALDAYDTYLRPGMAVSRAQAAEFLTRYVQHFLRRVQPAIPTQAAEEAGLADEMPRIDGSTSTLPLTDALYNTLFVNGYNHPMRPDAHSKTIDSYKRLIAGEADIILVPDPSSAVTDLAAEAQVELEYIPIASEALVFFTGKNNAAEGLTSEQIREIYVDNQYQNWQEVGGPDAPLAAFCRNNDSGSHAQMERFFLGDASIHADIQRERTSVAMASILTDVQQYEREHPGSFALGYSMYYYYEQTGMIVGRENLKLLAVDGVLPSEASIADGSYPLATYYYAVLRKDTPEDAPARRLAAWLTSEAGQAAIQLAGFGALSAN